MAEAAQKITMPMFKVSFKGEEKILGVLRTEKDGLPFIKIHPLIDKINSDSGSCLRLVDQVLGDRALDGGPENWRMIVPAAPFPVNAAIAYEKDGTKLGETIAFQAEGEPRLIMHTGKYRGEQGIALVCPGLASADIRSEGSDIVFAVPDSRLIPARLFPAKDGWYMPDAETTVPQGEEVDYSLDARYFWRVGGPYVGPLARDYHTRGAGNPIWQGVGTDHLPSVRFGVVVEVPAGDAAKFAGPQS